MNPPRTPSGTVFLGETRGGKVTCPGRNSLTSWLAARKKGRAARRRKKGKP